MTIEKLEHLRQSTEAPFNHQQFSVWLHNKIIDEIRYDMWEFREKQSMSLKSAYAACNHILNLASLKTIE